MITKSEMKLEIQQQMLKQSEPFLGKIEERLKFWDGSEEIIEIDEYMSDKLIDCIKTVLRDSGWEVESEDSSFNASATRFKIT
jgi:hypothetical protein